MHKFYAPVVLCVLMASFGAANTAAQNNYDELPDLGDTSGQTFSPQQDQALGKAFMRQIRHEGLVLDDDEATSYLRNLGRRLTMQSENPGHSFTFFFVNDPRINAFAGPGGYIGTNVGLIIAAETESELAGVLAHEIAHVTQRHLARAFDTASKLSVANTAALLAAILIGTQDGAAGAAALHAASALSLQQQINFTRANEKEADRVGIRALADAGFDPQGMAGFFEKLQKNARLYGTRPPEFLSTHPVTTDRIAEALSRAAEYPDAKPADELQFQLIRTKLRVASYENPRQVLADFQRFHGKSGGKTAVERYELALLREATSDYSGAQQVMQQLQRDDPDRLAYRLGLGRIHSNAGELAMAADIYKSSLELYPGDTTVVLPYASTLMAAGRNKEAHTLLMRSSNADPENPKVYKLLAQAAGKNGLTLQTHIAMAEYYYLNGYTRQAVEQMKLAEKSANLTDYEAARIAARLATLKQEMEKDESRK